MIKYFYLTHRWDPASTINLGQSGPGSNVNEVVLHISQSSRSGTSPSSAV